MLGRGDPIRKINRSWLGENEMRGAFITGFRMQPTICVLEIVLAMRSTACSIPGFKRNVQILLSAVDDIPHNPGQSLEKIHQTLQ